MRPPEPNKMADALLNAVYQAACRVCCGVDIDGWSDDHIKALLDTLIKDAGQNEVRIRGIRMDRATAIRLGLNATDQQYDPYNKVPVAALADQFSRLEIELAPVK